MNKPKVLSFGELLYRLQSNSSDFFNEKSASIFGCPGGSEANVAVTLAQLHIPSEYVSIAPANKLTSEIINTLNSKGVTTDKFIYKGDRLGSYILLGANGLTNGEVIYDRKYSSFASIKVEDIDWDLIFEDISWFHWTALTPALGEELVAVCEKALEVATAKGIFISVDLNYRNKLWQYGKDPIEVMPKLIDYCDLIMGNIWAANKMLGTSIEEAWSGDRISLDYFSISKRIAHEVFEKYSRCKHVAFTFRFMDNAKHNLLYGTYHNSDGDYLSKQFETNELIDRIGSGDAFMGGLIAAVVNEYDGQQIIDFATEIGFKKLFVKGDFITI